MNETIFDRVKDAPESAEQQLEQVLESASPDATTEQAEQSTEEATPQKKPDSPNFKIVRQRAEKAERERDELVARLSRYESQQSPAPTEEDLDFSIGSDDLAEGKHLSKVQKKIKNLEEKLSLYEQQTTTSLIENRLKSQYTDFDQVVNADNIQLLKESYPEIASTINSSSDLYNKAVTAYTLIKRFGIVPEDNFQPDRERVARNTAKPKNTQTISPQHGESPLSKANAFSNGLTKDLAQQLWKETLRAQGKL